MQPLLQLQPFAFFESSHPVQFLHSLGGTE